MSQPVSHKRRSPQQWQRLIEQWSESGLSAPKFCAQQQVVYSTFQAWRHRLKEQPIVREESESTNSGFIDLSQLSSHPHEHWRITLRLGNGVELELSQG